VKLVLSLSDFFCEDRAANLPGCESSSIVVTAEQLCNLFDKASAMVLKRRRKSKHKAKGKAKLRTKTRGRPEAAAAIGEIAVVEAARAPVTPEEQTTKPDWADNGEAVAAATKAFPSDVDINSPPRKKRLTAAMGKLGAITKKKLSPKKSSKTS
jgi:hypothetical protein